MGRGPGCRAYRGAGERRGGKLTDALRWSLDHADEWRAAKEAGFVPESLEPPQILDGYGGWFEDFWRLSTERQIGMALGPIPASAIERHVAGWPYEDAEAFEHCIREMDGFYMKTQNKTGEAPPDAGSPMEAFRGATSGRRGK
ncbi:phage tail assembly chaperone [Croceibacterium aestuarii]|uniref:phage tail assembly chaperone n=1 Tax=Croceibacterium aestuarii TaxID=3064139 RepID=UPI00272ED3CA|nr:hypothetical protein [Croceibacterium sp. D39]